MHHILFRLGIRPIYRGIETRVLKTRAPVKPGHFAKPETRVQEQLKPGFQVFFWTAFCTFQQQIVQQFNAFYPNVTTLRSGLCCRNSVCLSVVCNVGAPYSQG